MKLYYLANARIPTEKAHGLTIVKSCEALARAGAEVTLFLPRRKTQFAGDIFATYGVEKDFTIRYLPTFDVLRYSSSGAAFWISYATFYISAFFALLFVAKKDAVLYTRDTPLLTLSALGLPTYLECHHIFGRQERYFALARRARGIITISRALKDKFIAAGFDARKILVAPSGVDLSVFDIETPQADARKELGLPLEAKILVYTGNFTTMGQDKGLSDVLLALQELPGILFVAVGGSEKDIARYREEAEGLGVAAQTRFVGFNPQKVLARYQRAADILLMPFPDTHHYRAHMSPVKMFEYMASGRPIIASNLPTIREVLNEKNAAIVPPDDLKALIYAAHALLAEPTRAEALASQAKQEVQLYSWPERARRVLDFIR